jgi:hypothetical protein
MLDDAPSGDVFDDRVDLLRGVEQIVASQYNGAEGVGAIIDLTQSDRAIKLTYSYGDEVTIGALDRVERNVHLQDLSKDVPIDDMNFIEYAPDTTNAATPGVSQVQAFWTRVEGSDKAETVELTDFESQVNHYFNLRGGANEVNYNELTKSINLYIDGIDAWSSSAPLTTGLIKARAFATDGNGLELPEFDTIRSHNATNGITNGGVVAQGSLRIEASQDDQDTVTFNDNFDKYYTLLKNVDNSNEIVINRIDNSALTITLTGFEFLSDDGDSDDIYDFSQSKALERAQDNLTFLDSSTNDRDTIKVGNDAIAYDGGPAVLTAPADTISLEVLNDVFGMDFDVLDITAVTKANLLIVGDDDDQDNVAPTNSLDTDYVGPGDHDDDGANDLARDLVDDVVVGDLTLIDDVTGFANLWLTDKSVAGFTSYTLNVDDGELQTGSGVKIFGFDGTGLNASLVTSTGVSMKTVDTANVDLKLIGGGGADTITGGGGDDTIAGNGGADVLNGGVQVQVETVTFNGGGNVINADTLTIGGVTVGNAGGEDITVVAGADADQVGQALADYSNANWETALGLTAGELGSVDYNAITNVLTFTYTVAAGNQGNTVTVAGSPATGGLAATDDGVVTPFTDGADVFKFNKATDSTGAAMDQIQAFSFGAIDDVIDLSAIDANSTTAGDQAFQNVNINTTAQANLAAITALANTYFATTNNDIYVGLTATDAYVIVDSALDNKYTTADTVIQLVGITDLTGFVAADQFIK